MCTMIYTIRGLTPQRICISKIILITALRLCDKPSCVMGNTAVSFFYWSSLHSRHPAPRTNARGVCAKWDSIETWA
ncbi:hypothetical protein F4808DRAFT_421185 [Astrocystis sublimbata]|nr:hypothetical protein F4808DRAFT_421185 [Astrocystis sublimbata]